MGFRPPSFQPLPSPAVGHDFSVVLSRRVWNRPRVISAVLNTDATVANRFVSIVAAHPDGFTLWQVIAQTAQVASSAIAYTFAINLPTINSNAGAAVNWGLPDLWLPPGAIVKSSTSAIDAGDQWSGLLVAFEEVPAPEEADEYTVGMYSSN